MPGDPATTPAPPTDAITLPSTEILIPVGPVRPNEGATEIPVAADPTDTTTPTDSVPIVVIVEELPPADPPAGQADPSTPVVQDPAPAVAPPADTTDPGTAPAPDAGATDGTAIVVSADAPPSQPTTS